jgi:HK97 family phage portal protein
MAVSVPSIPRRAAALPSPRAERPSVQDAGGGVTITTAAELDAYLKSGSVTRSGMVVNSDTALRNGAVYACVRLLSGPPATLPLQIKRRVSAAVREDASDTRLHQVLNRRPNKFQKPHQFKRMMQAHVLLRGDGVALKVMSRGELLELVPLHPDRVKITQKDDLSLNFRYQRPNGGYTDFRQEEIFHLFGLTLNGYSGVTPITYARETIGLALAQEQYGASAFANGMRASGVLRHPAKLSDEARANLKVSLDDYRAGGESEGRFLILEEGMEQGELKMSAQDAQWIEARKLSRSDIAMFYGVPPTMIGDNSGSDSNWGTGLEQKKDAFVAFTLEDHLTMWEEAVTADLNTDEQIYARYNRAALVKGDIKTRWEAYAKGRRIKVLSANDVRALEDMNPIEGGDVYENPEIQVKPAKGEKDEDENDDDPKSS